MTSSFNNTMYSEEDRGLVEALQAGLSHNVPNETWTVDEITKRYKNCMLQPEMPADTRGELFCSRIFDGWSCWNYTKAGQVAHVSCPYFVTGFDPRRQGLRACMPSGEWFRHPALPNSSGWSNYTTCIDIQDLVLRQMVNTTYMSGYAISLAALILSLIIFAVFRSALNSTRVRIHTNLFVSFIINNSFWILWYQAIVDDVRLLDENPAWCQAIHIMLQYFMVANYCWMFCEGLYLHTLLAVAFVTEQKLMKWLYVIGWLVPAVFILIYGLVRGMFPTETTWCWMEESKYIWLLSTPVCISMITNFIFLVRIVWILVRKLRAAPGNEDHNNAWRAVRATLILIPLLGLNYMMQPFRPEPGAPGEDVYQILNAITTSLQGFCVALLFCFINGEVIQQFKKRWHQSRMMQRKAASPYSCAFTTLSTLPATEVSVANDLDHSSDRSRTATDAL